MRRLPPLPEHFDRSRYKGRVYSHRYVMKRIYEIIHTEGSVAGAARRMGVSKVFLHKVIRGLKSPGDKLTAYLGLERHIVYIPTTRLRLDPVYIEPEPTEVEAPDAFDGEIEG